MKLVSILIFLSLFMNSTLKSQVLKTSDDTLAYSIGVLIGNNLKNEGFGDLNTDLINAGLNAVLKGQPTLLSPEECNNNVRDNSTKRKMKLGEANKISGEQFLAANKSKAGVITLEDGLQYEVLKMGDGAKPTLTDKVLVHYTGTLIDGTKFDSSVDRGEPITFPCNQVIAGWTEVLQLMPVGSKWKVYIPYQLAYGERGAGQQIQPYSALIFEIELLGIE